MTEFDQESRLIDDDHATTRLWLRMLTCTNLIESTLRSKMREEFSTTLPRFDFLAQLQRAPEGLSMGEISQRMMVSGGNVSGIASHLEQMGWIQRDVEPNNRRTYIVTLTPLGTKRFAEMAARHEEWLNDLLGELSSEDHSALMRALAVLKRGISEQGDDR